MTFLSVVNGGKYFRQCICYLALMARLRMLARTVHTWLV
jgi:hypothetical protein